MKRTELREHIFRMVFGIEFNAPEEMPEQMGLYFEQLGDVREDDLEYIRTKVQKVAARSDEIDSMLNAHTTGWKTGRMNKVDLTILRLAVYEMKWDEEVPTGVAIDEAVELAKKYSSDDGPAFVNAVLAKIANPQRDDKTVKTAGSRSNDKIVETADSRKNDKTVTQKTDKMIRTFHPEKSGRLANHVDSKTSVSLESTAGSDEGISS